MRGTHGFASACALCLAALLGGARVSALPLNFVIEFDEASGFVSADWSGTYTVDGGVLTAFSATIGPFVYNQLTVFNDDPDDNDTVSTIVVSSSGGGTLRLEDNQGAAENVWVTIIDGRAGAYRTTLVPEPHVAGLLLTGAAALALRRRSKRSDARRRTSS